MHIRQSRQSKRQILPMIVAVLFLFMPGVSMLVKMALRRMTVLSAICTMGVGIGMAVLMDMFMKMAVYQLTMPVRVIMKVLMPVTVFMPVLQLEDLTRAVTFIAEREKIERVLILISQKLGR